MRKVLAVARMEFCSFAGSFTKADDVLVADAGLPAVILVHEPLSIRDLR